MSDQTREKVISTLLLIPNAIRNAEAAVLLASKGVQIAKESLEAKEAELLQGALIDGKNAEIRKAQLMQHTTTERAALRTTEDIYAQTALNLRCLQTEFAVYRALSRLLASGDD